MPHLAAALLILVMLALPSGAFAQAGVSYQVPADNPFLGHSGFAPAVYALGLRNPFRFSFDRATGDILIGDVGQASREEIDWIGRAAARGANFGWACREGTIPGPRPDECPVPGAIGPLFEYSTSGLDAVTGGFVVHDQSLEGLVGRYLYADFFAGDIRSLELDFGNPDDRSTGLTVSSPASFGEDASGRLYVSSHNTGEVARLIYGGSLGTLDTQLLTGPFGTPISIATFPGDTSRLFVAGRGGMVRLVVDDVARPTPYLDVAPFGLSSDGERGLLSVTAAPDYAATGRIYVYYTDLGGDIRIDEFTRSATDPETADPASRRNVLVMEHSQANNHNGGQMHFGADGCLWVTTGDGGGANDQFNNAQNLNSPLGKLLRIDPDPPGVGGPPCGSAAAPPQGPVPETEEGPVPDTTAPLVFASAPRRQRVLRQRGAFVNVRCSEHCSLSAGGTLVIGRRRLLLLRVPAALTGGSTARLLVRARPRARRLLRAALRRGRRPRVELRLHASDAAGNRSPLVRRSVRVRR